MGLHSGSLKGCHRRQDATKGATWSWQEVVLHLFSPLLGGLCWPGGGFGHWVGCWSCFSGATDSYCSGRSQHPVVSIHRDGLRHSSCYCDPTTWMAWRSSCRHWCHNPSFGCFEHLPASQDPLQGRTVEPLAASLWKRWGCLDS